MQFAIIGLGVLVLPALKEKKKNWATKSQRLILMKTGR